MLRFCSFSKRVPPFTTLLFIFSLIIFPHPPLAVIYSKFPIASQTVEIIPPGGPPTPEDQIDLRRDLRDTIFYPEFNEPVSRRLLIVKFRDSVDSAQIQTLLAAKGMMIVERLLPQDQPGGGSPHVYLLFLGNFEEPAPAFRSLSQESDVEYASFNYVYQSETPQYLHSPALNPSTVNDRDSLSPLPGKYRDPAKSPFDEGPDFLKGIDWMKPFEPKVYYQNRFQDFQKGYERFTIKILDSAFTEDYKARIQLKPYAEALRYGFPERDPYYSDYKTENILQAWGDSKGMNLGSDAAIGLIASGINTDHPDLLGATDFDNSASIVRGKEGLTFDPEREYLKDDHSLSTGTICAGIISARVGNDLGVAGIAPLSKIVALRTGAASRKEKRVWEITQWELLRAILYLKSKGVKVALFPFEIPPERGYTPILEETLKSGGPLLLILSAGASGKPRETYPFYDTDLSLIVSVHGQDERYAAYANRGDGVDLSTYGEGVYSTFWRDDYAQVTAVYIGAAKAAGLAALMMALNPDITPAQIKERISFRYTEKEYGGKGDLAPRRLDAYASLLKLTPTLFISLANRTSSAAPGIRLFWDPSPPEWQKYIARIKPLTFRPSKKRTNPFFASGNVIIERSESDLDYIAGFNGDWIELDRVSYALPSYTDYSAFTGSVPYSYRIRFRFKPELPPTLPSPTFFVTLTSYQDTR